MDSSRPVEDILHDLNPKKSAAVYEKRWMEFQKFHGKQNPTEDSLLQFFDYLKRVRGYKASSLWSWYSCINSKYSILYGQKLQTMPRLQALMKSFNAGYERCSAKTFTRDQLYEFLGLPLATPRAILVKAGVCIGFCGGLRMFELRSLNMADLQETKDGLIVKYNAAKQRGEVKNNTFIIPKNSTEPAKCMFSYVNCYMNQLNACGIMEGPLFRTCLASRYSQVPMGHNLLAQCGKYMAEALGLEEPHRYTGHCLRRSAASAAADAGATTMDMQRHMNWKSQATALRYVDNSMQRLQRMSKMICGHEQHVQSKSDDSKKQNPGKENRTYNITVQSGATLNLY